MPTTSPPDKLGTGRNALRGLLRIGAVDNHQVTDFAPCRISRSQLDSPHVQNLVQTPKKTDRLPSKGECPDTQPELLPMNSSTHQERAL